MSAPTSGSSGSSSSAAPVPGYYPDPSIPNYIRYWNGSAWVPGTSRPAPLDTVPSPGGPERAARDASPADASPAGASGEDAGSGTGPGPGSGTGPDASAGAGEADDASASAGPEAAGTPAARQPGVEESGPMFLDEDPAAPRSEPGPGAEPAADPRAGLARPAAPDPGDDAPAWPRLSPPAAGLPRISWGAEPAPSDPPTPASQSPAAGQGFPPAGTGAGGPQAGLGGAAGQAGPGAAQGFPAQDAGGGRAGQVQGAGGGQAGGAGSGAGAGWAAQVQGLAQGAELGWRPPPDDPFGAQRGHDRPGGLVRRFAARVIDAVVLGAITGAAAVPLGTAAYHHAKDKVDQARLTGQTVKVWLIDGTTGTELGALLAVFLVAALLLEVLPTARWGRTLGKKLVGLRVLDIEAQMPPGFGASLRRWLTRTVLGALVVGVVGVAWCLFDRPWKQCWHDKAAHTFVAGV